MTELVVASVGVGVLVAYVGVVYAYGAAYGAAYGRRVAGFFLLVLVAVVVEV